MMKKGVKDFGLLALVVALVIGVVLIIGCMESEKHTEKTETNPDQHLFELQYLFQVSI